MFRVTRYLMISKTEWGWVGYRKKYWVAGRVRVPAGHWTPLNIFFLSWNKGQLWSAITWHCRLSTPLCHTYSEPSEHELSPGGTQNIPYLFKNLSKSRLSDPFFGLFLVICEVGSQIYIANLAIFKIWVFSATFWHEITLYAIDVDKKRFRTPFLINTLEPLWKSALNQTQLSEHLRMTHIYY